VSSIIPMTVSCTAFKRANVCLHLTQQNSKRSASIQIIRCKTQITVSCYLGTLGISCYLFSLAYAKNTLILHFCTVSIIFQKYIVITESVVVV
jgi:hypothetical protein